MKKISFIIVLISGILSFQPSVSFAQFKIMLGPVVGLTSPTADYGGTPSDYYEGYYYGLKPGFNFGVAGKLNHGHLNINLSILYSSMGNSGAADINTSGSTVDYSQHLLTIGIGPQFGFGVPASPVIPYIGLDFLVSSIARLINISRDKQCSIGYSQYEDSNPNRSWFRWRCRDQAF